LKRSTPEVDKTDTPSQHFEYTCYVELHITPDNQQLSDSETNKEFVPKHAAPESRDEEAHTAVSAFSADVEGVCFS